MKHLSRRRLVVATTLFVGISLAAVGTASAVGTGPGWQKPDRRCLVKLPPPNPKVVPDPAASTKSSLVGADGAAVTKPTVPAGKGNGLTHRPCPPRWGKPIVKPTTPPTFICQA